MAKLTKRVVEAIAPPKAGVVDTWDEAVPGYHLRTYPSGRRVYRLKYRAAGKQRNLTIGVHGDGMTAEQAREAAILAWNGVMGGRDPIEDKGEATRTAAERKRRRVSVAQLAERWLTEGRDAAPNKRESSWITDAACLRRHIVPTLGDIAVAALNKSDIEKAQSRIAAGATARDERTGWRGRAIVTGGKGIARRSIAALSACLSWAVDQEIIPTNPCARVKKLPQGKQERFLSEAEVASLLDCISKMTAEGALAAGFGDAIRVLLLTGARKAEILKLKWSEVDMERGQIRLPPDRGKRGERTVSLNAPALKILSDRERCGEYVFPSTRDHTQPALGLQKAWERVRHRAGLQDVRIHDLRHSFASFGAASGASLVMIGKALGHSQPQMTARYAHLGADPVRAFAETVGEKIMESRSPKVAGGEVLPLRRPRP
jgi:integrase